MFFPLWSGPAKLFFPINPALCAVRRGRGGLNKLKLPFPSPRTLDSDRGSGGSGEFPKLHRGRTKNNTYEIFMGVRGGLKAIACFCRVKKGPSPQTRFHRAFPAFPLFLLESEPALRSTDESSGLETKGGGALRYRPLGNVLLVLHARRNGYQAPNRPPYISCQSVPIIS